MGLYSWQSKNIREHPPLHVGLLVRSCMPAEKITESKETSSSSSEEIFPHAEEVEELIHTDAEALMQHFRASYDQIRTGLKRPRVLIAGTAGAGKR